MARVVIDTNVFVSALMSADGAAREVLRLALSGIVRPVFGNALFAEYEDVLARDSLFEGCHVDAADRIALLDALLSVSDWTQVYFLWRPNLADEGDNHVLELAIAGNASTIITENIRDFRRSELSFPGLRFLTARDFLEWRRRP